jgi:hypothetical protein
LRSTPTLSNPGFDFRSGEFWFSLVPVKDLLAQLENSGDRRAHGFQIAAAFGHQSCNRLSWRVMMTSSPWATRSRSRPNRVLASNAVTLSIVLFQENDQSLAILARSAHGATENFTTRFRRLKLLPLCAAPKRNCGVNVILLCETQ